MSASAFTERKEKRARESPRYVQVQIMALKITLFMLAALNTPALSVDFILFKLDSKLSAHMTNATSNSISDVDP